MQAPLLVRPRTDAEHTALETGLRSPAAGTLRRAQILLASTGGAHVPAIARALGGDEQTGRNAIPAFAERGVAILTPGSSRPRTVPAACDAAGAEHRKARLPRSPRDVGHPTSLWTLDLAAATAHDQGLTATRLSGEPVRATLARLGGHGRRATGGSTSPDPADARKKAPAPA